MALSPHNKTRRRVGVGRLVGELEVGRRGKRHGQLLRRTKWRLGSSRRDMPSGIFGNMGLCPRRRWPWMDRRLRRIIVWLTIRLPRTLRRSTRMARRWFGVLGSRIWRRRLRLLLIRCSTLLKVTWRGCRTMPLSWRCIPCPCSSRERRRSSRVVVFGITRWRWRRVVRGGRTFCVPTIPKVKVTGRTLILRRVTPWFLVCLRCRKKNRLIGFPFVVIVGTRLTRFRRRSRSRIWRRRGSTNRRLVVLSGRAPR